MEYLAEHIDPKKFQDALEHHRDFQAQELRLEIEKARAFYDGYEKAILTVKDMFHCCNYESRGKQTQAHREGADNAFYELCKELDIGSQDIRDMDISIDEKATLIAERIRKLFDKSNAET